MKRALVCITAWCILTGGTCWSQDIVLEPLFGFWKFTRQEASTSSYYVLNVYSPELTAVRGKSEGIEDTGTTRDVWAYYNDVSGKYRLIDTVSSFETDIWEFSIDGTTATGVCYHSSSGSTVAVPAEGTRMGDRDPNYPPAVPGNPTPLEGAFNLPLDSVSLSWDCTDPDTDDTLFYDVHFGPQDNLSLAWEHKNITRTSATFSDLSAATTYSWKVVARDEYQGETEGPVWHFTTLELIEPEDTEPDPGPDPGQDNESSASCPVERVLQDDPESLESLRQFRDKTLMNATAGRALIALYYKTAPFVCRALEQYPPLGRTCKTVLKALVPAVKNIPD